MKYFTVLFCSLLLFVGIEAGAQNSIIGTWEGVLQVAPGNELDVQFTIESKADGSYSATLNSPVSGAIKNVAASKVDYNNSELAIEVAELSGSFKGSLTDGKLVGSWNQVGQAIPLTLVPYRVKSLSPELAEQLAGPWNGKLEVPGMSLTTVLNFSLNEDGSLGGNFGSPDQGPQMFALENLKVNATEISFEVGAIRGRYKGNIEGSKITGEWSQGRSFPLNFGKGDLDPRSFALALSEQDLATLKGTWHGDMTTPVGPVTAVFRFEEVEPGFVRGYFDSPDRGAIGLPLKSASINDDAVIFEGRSGSSFKGKLVDGELTGDYRQQGQTLPVTLKKGELPPLLLDLPDTAPNILVGNWTGTMNSPNGTLRIGIRFETDPSGKLMGFIDSPDQGMTGARIRTVSMQGNQLTLSSALIGFNYKAQISQSEMNGKLSRGPEIVDVVLTRQ